MSESPEGSRRRAVARAALIGLALVLPWAVPAIPRALGSLASSHPAAVAQPVPPERAPTAGPSPTSQAPVAGVPLEVVVPRLRLRARVEPISGQSGELAPPADARVLGWWQEGRGVGAAAGSAVVIGHTVSAGEGVFDHLGRLVPGDQIRVRTSAGWILYEVGSSREYTVRELAEDAPRIFRLDGPGRLVLITCSRFDGTTYLERTVVYAVPGSVGPGA